MMLQRSATWNLALGFALLVSFGACQGRPPSEAQAGTIVDEPSKAVTDASPTAPASLDRTMRPPCPAVRASVDTLEQAQLPAGALERWPLEETIIWTSQARAWLGEATEEASMLHVELSMDSVAQILVETPKPGAWKACSRRVEFDAEVEVRVGELMHWRVPAHFRVMDSKTLTNLSLGDSPMNMGAGRVFMSMEVELGHGEPATSQIQIYGNRRRDEHGAGDRSTVSEDRALLGASAS